MTENINLTTGTATAETVKVTEPAKASEPAKTTESVSTENLQAELDKIKKANDALAKENAEHKRKERERMNEEERIKAEEEEKNQRYLELNKELAKTKVETVFAKNGLEETEYKSVMEGLIALGENASHDTLTKIADSVVKLVVSREKKATELTKTSMLKDSVVNPEGDDNSSQTSLFKEYMKSEIELPSVVKLK